MSDNLETRLSGALADLALERERTAALHETCKRDIKTITALRADLELRDAEINRLQLEKQAGDEIIFSNTRQISELKAEIAALKAGNHWPLAELPDCMTPDGAEPCDGFKSLQAECETLQKQQAEFETEIANNRAELAEARALKEALLDAQREDPSGADAMEIAKAIFTEGTHVDGFARTCIVDLIARAIEAAEAGGAAQMRERIANVVATYRVWSKDAKAISDAIRALSLTEPR